MASSIHSERSPQPEGSVSPKRILVVEDEWIVAVDMQRTLQRAGYVCPEFVTDAARVLATFDRLRPDLVLLDIDLGGELDGGQLAEKIRALSAVPLVFVSAHCDAPTLRRVMRATPQGFVVKPFTEAQLVTAIELALHPRNDAPAPDTDARDTLSRIRVLLGEAGIPVEGASEPRRSMPALAVLSTREREILDRLLAHQRVPGIARTLNISENTVRNHLKSMYAKLGVHSQEELLELVVRGPKRTR